ncbi:hypothetical protein [Nostoc sp. NMS4]|uniref:hypothetical protein n=1 Tax=Nostoc sp. NMS4 TaxID=2815390 RepID=UPI0025DAE236|nr:hypothetical protein [Nostoc sp. NMS4]MBN3928026.1 hypothetical protein [Nostoc sp. NMS4]
MEEDLEFSQNSEIDATESTTLYKIASDAMKDYIEVYLSLSKQSNGFSNIQNLDLTSRNSRVVVIHGLSLQLNPDTSTSEEIKHEAERMLAVTFDTELAITAGVYERMRFFANSLVDNLFKETDDLKFLQPEYLSANPGLLPLFQQLAGLRSKSELKREVGNVSDKRISKVVANKISDRINRNLKIRPFSKERLLQSVEPTLEGIVRDLVGKVLLENIVADALSDLQVPFTRESEYKSLRGVIYDFRADFVIPDAQNPLAFIEVRKSSSRHASLYAKDKMFSAINWKGRNKKLLGIVVVEGAWTRETLRIMANVFDYVTPLTRVSQVA